MRRTIIASSSGMIIFITAFVSITSYATLLRLPVPESRQRGNTCWAATAVAILSQYGMMPDERSSHNGAQEYIGLCVAINQNNWVQRDCEDTDLSLYCTHDCCQYWLGEKDSRDPCIDDDDCTEWAEKCDTDEMFCRQKDVCTFTNTPRVLLEDVYGLSLTAYENDDFITPEQIEVEIVAGRPMALKYDPAPDPNDTGLHYVSIIGYDPDDDTVAIMNGWPEDNIQGGYWIADYNYLETRWCGHCVVYFVNNSPEITQLDIKAPPWIAGTDTDGGDRIYVSHADDWQFYFYGNIVAGPYVIQKSEHDTDGVSVDIFHAINGSTTMINGFKISEGSVSNIQGYLITP